MMFSSIRSRMLLVALFPLSAVVIAMVLVLWTGRVDDLDYAHEQRSRLIARQVALSSELSLFTGNTASLQGLLEGILREPEVAGVAVFDGTGARVALAGIAAPDILELASAPFAKNRGPDGWVDVVVQPVFSTRLALDDLFTQSTQAGNSESSALGYVVLQVSRSALEERHQRALELAILLGALALLLGGVLAVQLGRTVVGPISRVSRMIQRIGRGDFSAHFEVSAADPLYDMQVALNHMTQRLGWGREELERQIERATEALQHKKEEAEQATQAKSRFLAAASHDLRQPTHALGMFIARMGQLPMDGQMSDLVRNLEISVQAMQDLLDSLLDLSRLESGAMPVVPESVSLAEVLQGVAPSLQQMAADKGLHLRIRQTHLWVHSDASLLQRIVLNLVHNSIRYTESGGILVACRSEASGRQVRLEVWDTGVGIAAENQAEIFKEFFQVDNPGRARSQGLGLGLNIVQRSAALLEHTISLQSRPGFGTRFILTMQRTGAVPHRDKPVPTSPPVPQDEFAGRTMLVVDDDPVVLMAVASLLESWGCKVQAASSVAQAMSWVETDGAPDIIISDFQLGSGANGLNLIASLRALAGRDVAACLMSGDTGAELLNASKADALTVLHKPVRPAKLRNLLRRLLQPADQAWVGR